MIRGKKGGIFLGVVFAIFLFMIGMWVLPFMKDEAATARTNLQCTNSSISDGGKATCLFVGFGVPYFIIAILIFIGGLVGNKL